MTSPTDETAKEKTGPYQLFMLALCVYVLAALAAETFLRLSVDTKTILNYVDTGICVIFLIDFFVQLIRADSKLGYLKWGWIDFISSIPMVGPLRLGRAVRVFRILRLMRGVRSSKQLVSYILAKRAEFAFLSVLLISIILVVFSSIAILNFENAQNANIASPADALWWSFVTITTVGYGDVFPVTSCGRVIAAVLMTAGVGLFGTFTGFVASWFVGEKGDNKDPEIALIRNELKEIKGLLETLNGKKTG